MITEWFLTLASGFMDWFWSLFDGIEIPPWVAGLDDQINGILANVGGLAVWFPWALAIGIAAVTGGTYLVCMVLKYGRAVLSYVPFFGGAG